MNDVSNLKYYDKNNLILDEIPYSQVVFQSKDSTVYSVTQGEVVTVTDIEDFKVIIVKKDKLFYTYSNLKSAFVKKGDIIKPDQIIGYAAVDLDGTMPTLDFYMNDEKTSIPLAENNFIPRKNNSLNDHSFDPVKEPE